MLQHIKGTGLLIPEPLHFLLPEPKGLVTVVYPAGVPDSQLETRRMVRTVILLNPTHTSEQHVVPIMSEIDTTTYSIKMISRKLNYNAGCHVVFSCHILILNLCRNCISSLSCQTTGPILGEPMLITSPMSLTKMVTYEIPIWPSHIPLWIMERYNYQFED